MHASVTTICKILCIRMKRQGVHRFQHIVPRSVHLCQHFALSQIPHLNRGRRMSCGVMVTIAGECNGNYFIGIARRSLRNVVEKSPQKQLENATKRNIFGKE